jgi:hypothetical protein
MARGHSFVGISGFYQGWRQLETGNAANAAQPFIERAAALHRTVNGKDGSRPVLFAADAA